MYAQLHYTTPQYTQKKNFASTCSSFQKQTVHVIVRTHQASASVPQVNPASFLSFYLKVVPNQNINFPVVPLPILHPIIHRWSQAVTEASIGNCLLC